MSVTPGLLAAADQQRAYALDEYDLLVEAAATLLAEGVDPTQVCMALGAVAADDLEVDPDTNGGGAAAVAMLAAAAVRQAHRDANSQV